eukprot:maker-scaffold37_size504123-snap-gene-4.18 protein:Tk07381 transcript:maker-scaffold37_size504123-snap-gene-4.18-mRNA-1 annotation:"hypothetical protein"
MSHLGVDRVDAGFPIDLVQGFQATMEAIWPIILVQLVGFAIQSELGVSNPIRHSAHNCAKVGILAQIPVHGVESESDIVLMAMPIRYHQGLNSGSIRDELLIPKPHSINCTTFGQFSRPIDCAHTLSPNQRVRENMAAAERTSHRIATFNVHSFTDAKGQRNFRRVLELIEEHDVDILCLQETGLTDSKKLFQAWTKTSAHGLVAWNHCAILSKFHLEPYPKPMNKIGSSTRFVIAKVLLNDLQSIYVSCVHLNHRREPTRMSELNEICTYGNNVQSCPHVMSGDFNALTLEDYPDDELLEICKVRSQNRWETPQRAITDKMINIGYVDAKSKATEFSGALSTCRFNTRIDYVFINRAFDDMFTLTKLIHVDDKASDHNMVILEIESEKGSSNEESNRLPASKSAA